MLPFWDRKSKRNWIKNSHFRGREPKLINQQLTSAHETALWLRKIWYTSLNSWLSLDSFNRRSLPIFRNQFPHFRKLRRQILLLLSASNILSAHSNQPTAFPN